MSLSVSIETTTLCFHPALLLGDLRGDSLDLLGLVPATSEVGRKGGRIYSVRHRGKVGSSCEPASSSLSPPILCPTIVRLAVLSLFIDFVLITPAFQPVGAEGSFSHTAVPTSIA